jgi:hypothetical protein
MRMAVVGALVVAGLTTAAVAVRPDGSKAFGERMESYCPTASDSHFVAFSTTVENKYEQLTVIDSTRSVILVYHVELASGSVELRSVRNIESDLQLYDYNGKPPLPSEIRSQLGFR